MGVFIYMGVCMPNYNEIIYQIYPLGFVGAPKENDGVTVNRIHKVIDWIPHFTKLSVTSILFNPIFESGTHGYDTKDFDHIDCRLGTNDDFKEVSKQLHKNNIKVILDGVFNHVGREFSYFKDVLEKKWDSPYCEYFYIDFNNQDNPDGFTYVNWEGHSMLVKLNLDNPKVRQYLIDKVDTWIKEYEIDGLRLDVAYTLNHTFMQELCAHVRESHPDFLFIGEMIHGDYNILFNQGHLNSVTNYECYKGIYSSFNSKNLYEIAYSLNRQFGNEDWCLYRGKHLLSFLDNHDVNRIASNLEDSSNLPLAYALLFAMPGMPCIYYGSEWGATGMRTPESDAALRPCFDEYTYNDLSKTITKLSQIRKDNPILAYGTYRQLSIQNETLVFERVLDDKKVIFGINMSQENKEMDIQGEYEALDLIDNKKVSLSHTIVLQPKSFCFYLV